jgi:hypothetical protein
VAVPRQVPRETSEKVPKRLVEALGEGFVGRLVEKIDRLGENRR